MLAAIVLVQLCNMADVRGDGPRPIATVMESLIGPEVLSDNLIVVRRVAEELDADARFDYLADWVLSSADHTDVRLIGWFPPATPKPGSLLANADDRLAFDLPVSPAIDLLNAAIKAKRTEELANRIAALPDEQASQQRSRQTLAFMLAVATGDEVRAVKELSVLVDGVEKRVPDHGPTWWPEITAVAFVMQQDRQPEGFAEFIQQLFVRRVSDSSGAKNHGQDLFVTALNAHFNPTTRQPAHQTRGENPFSFWGPASVRKANTDGRGYGNVAWAIKPRAVQKVAGHNRDALYFPCPLTGNCRIRQQFVGVSEFSRLRKR